MRTFFKAAVTTAGVVFAFLAFSVIYSTLKGYTAWFARIPKAVVTADGKQIRGWVHRARDGQALFLTRADSDNPVTYNLMFPAGGRNSIVGCGTWVAPRLPFLPIGDVDPPCFFAGGHSGHNLSKGERSVSFVADDGARIEARW